MSSSPLDQLLPPSLLLSPHLSAYRYFFVCSLTICAWDTLVLSSRSWRTMKTREWPLLKIVLLLLRFLLPAVFIIQAVAVFNDTVHRSSCQKITLFDPISTAVLLSLSSLALVMRVSAVHKHERSVTSFLYTLLGTQVAMHIASCFFFQALNLKDTQGCITAPKHRWVGLCWVLPTIVYFSCLVLATKRSFATLRESSLSLWKVFNRDGLNLYATILIVNLVNVIFFFASKPEDDADPLRVIVTSMATVLTCTMTMRIILLVRGSLAYGGSYFPYGSSDSSYETPGAGGSNSLSKAKPQTSSFIVGDGEYQRHDSSGHFRQSFSQPKRYSGRGVGGLTFLDPRRGTPTPPRVGYNISVTKTIRNSASDSKERELDLASLEYENDTGRPDHKVDHDLDEGGLWVVEDEDDRKMGESEGPVEEQGAQPASVQAATLATSRLPGQWNVSRPLVNAESQERRKEMWDE